MALSTIIASFGLLSNSTAVVIGAMLVAPLMTPIMGMALALSVGERKLFRDASLAEFFGVMLSVAVASFIGRLALDVDFGPEIMARTTPTTYDIFVALAAGLAGAYSMVDERINAALPGVAIATSLVPPLTVSGLCLAQGRYELAGNAFLLFFANFLCIQLASAAIFIRFGFNRLEAIGTDIPFTHGLFVRRFGLSLLLLAAVTLFMSKTLYHIVTDKIFYRQLETVVKEEMQARLGAQLTELRYTRDKSNNVNAVASVLTPQEYLPADVEALEKKVAGALGENVHFTVRSLLSKDADSHGPVFMLDEEKLRREQKNEEAKFLSKATNELDNQLAEIPGARLVDIRRENQDAIESLNVVVRSPVAVRPEQIKSMQAALRKTLNPDLRLIVRSILTRDADAEHYLYDVETKEKVEEPMIGVALEFFKKLEGALKQALAATKEGSSLSEFRYARREKGLSVLAVVKTPENFTPQQVSEVQASLQAALGQSVFLVVRSVVGVDTGAGAYIPSLDEGLFLNPPPPAMDETSKGQERPTAGNESPNPSPEEAKK